MNISKSHHYFYFSLLLIAGLIWGAVFQLPDGQLHLVFCDVGQGDAILATYGQTQVLIDGGPNSQVLGCLSENMPFWDRTLEMVILTHQESDHFGGLIDVIKRYNVTQFVVNSVANNSASFWEFRKQVLDEQAEIYSPKAGDKLKFGPMEFLVLWPPQKLGDSLVWQSTWRIAKEKILGVASVSGEINDTSIVLQLSFGDFDALLTGDISAKIETQVGLENGPPADGQIEVLKVAHHGSKYSSSAEFLRQLQPKLAVISVGRNSFGHPTKEVIEQLSNLAIKLLRTDKDGEIEIVSDGKSWYTRKR